MVDAGVEGALPLFEALWMLAFEHVQGGATTAFAAGERPEAAKTLPVIAPTIRRSATTSSDASSSTPDCGGHGTDERTRQGWRAGRRHPSVAGSARSRGALLHDGAALHETLYAELKPVPR